MEKLHTKSLTSQYCLSTWCWPGDRKTWNTPKKTFRTKVKIQKSLRACMETRRPGGTHRHRIHRTVLQKQHVQVSRVALQNHRSGGSALYGKGLMPGRRPAQSRAFFKNPTSRVKVVSQPGLQRTVTCAKQSCVRHDGLRGRCPKRQGEPTLWHARRKIYLEPKSFSNLYHQTRTPPNHGPKTTSEAAYDPSLI